MTPEADQPRDDTLSERPLEAPVDSSDSLAVETRALTVYYGRRLGIDRLRLAVRRGEVYGLLGSSGAGKTTTLRVLLDLVRPTLGRATIFGQDCQSQGVQVRRRVGYLPGRIGLHAKFTAQAYLDLVASLRGDASEPTYRQSLIERLELNASRPLQTCSAGDTQKVGIVAAFMGRPDLLLLDEPTSHLDPPLQQQVLALVREARGEGRTVLFASPNLHEAQSVCDRISMIREGRLIATEKVNTLVRGQYHRLRLRFERLPPAGILEEAGARELARTDQDVMIEVRGSLNDVLTRAVEYGVLDLQDHPFTLEDVFLAYYGVGTVEPYA